MLAGSTPLCRYYDADLALSGISVHAHYFQAGSCQRVRILANCSVAMQLPRHRWHVQTLHQMHSTHVLSRYVLPILCIGYCVHVHLYLLKTQHLYWFGPETNRLSLSVDP